MVCILLYLIGPGPLQQRCVQPWAVSQLTTDAHFGILCPSPDTVFERKAFVQGLGPACLERAKQVIGQVTGHHVHSCLVLLGLIYLFPRIYSNSINPSLEVFVHLEKRPGLSL